MSGWIVVPMMVALLAASAFFSASETALFSLQKETIFEFRGGKSRRAHLAARLLESPRELLATILFGNLIVNTSFYAMTALTAYRLADRGLHAAAGAVGVGGLALVIVFGEVLPKATALSFNTGVALAVSAPLFLVYVVLRPVRMLVGTIVRPTTALALRIARPPSRITLEELSILVDATQAQGHIPPQEGEMIEDVMVLGETRVREVMTPRVDIVAIRKGAAAAELVELFRRTRRTKIPVYERDIDDITGVAYVKDAIIEPGKTLEAVTGPVKFVPEAKTAEALLFDFQKERARVAVVVDEYGGTAGIVTLADLVEEIVGPIGDEYATPENLVEEKGPGVYRLAGDLSIKDWNELFDQYMANERLSTLGGFLVLLLGRVPRAGDKVTYQNILFTIEEVRRHRIEWVRAELLPDEGGGEARK